jgi:hypothetical protein
MFTTTTVTSNNLVGWLVWFMFKGNIFTEIMTMSNKIDRHDITEILLKVVLNTINHNHKKEWKNLKLSY